MEWKQVADGYALLTNHKGMLVVGKVTKSAIAEAYRIWVRVGDGYRQNLIEVYATVEDTIEANADEATLTAARAKTVKTAIRKAKENLKRKLKKLETLYAMT